MTQLEFPQLDTIEKQWKFFEQSINSLGKKQIKLKSTTGEYRICGSGKKHDSIPWGPDWA